MLHDHVKLSVKAVFKAVNKGTFFDLVKIVLTTLKTGLMPSQEDQDQDQAYSITTDLNYRLDLVVDRLAR